MSDGYCECGKVANFIITDVCEDCFDGYYVHYDKVVEVCGGGVYGNDPLELITQKDNRIFDLEAEIDTLRILVDEWAYRAVKTEAEVEKARGTAQYWKDNHLAGNLIIERYREALKKLRLMSLKPEYAEFPGSVSRCGYAIRSVDVQEITEEALELNGKMPEEDV